MARSYQVSVPPGTATKLADSTLGGGNNVTIRNDHATESLMLGGDENQLATGGGTALSSSTGFRVAAGGTFTRIIEGNEAIYGIAGTSTVTVTAHVYRSNHLA